MSERRRKEKKKIPVCIYIVPVANLVCGNLLVTQIMGEI
jgi:hypothetical protein